MTTTFFVLFFLDRITAFESSYLMCPQNCILIICPLSTCLRPAVCSLCDSPVPGVPQEGRSRVRPEADRGHGSLDVCLSGDRPAQGAQTPERHQLAARVPLATRQEGLAAL